MDDLARDDLSRRREPQPFAAGLEPAIPGRESTPGTFAGPGHDVTSEREARLFEVLTTYLQAVESGEALSRDALLSAHPDLAGDLAAFLAEEDRLQQLTEPLRQDLDMPPYAPPSGFRSDQDLEPSAAASPARQPGADFPKRSRDSDSRAINGPEISAIMSCSKPSARGVWGLSSALAKNGSIDLSRSR